MVVNFIISLVIGLAYVILELIYYLYAVYTLNVINIIASYNYIYIGDNYYNTIVM